MSQLDKALTLASLGLHVFPVKKDKTPMTKGGFKAASTDTGLVKAWWSKAPSALIGVATGASGLVVLDVDVDTDKGKNGFETLDAAGIEVDWKETFGYYTRRGGYHAVYKAPDGLKVPSGANITLDGRKLASIDRRAEGAYVVWWGDPPSSTDTFASAPSWLVAERKEAVLDPSTWKDIPGIEDILIKPEPREMNYGDRVKEKLNAQPWQLVYGEYIPTAKIGKPTGSDRIFIACPLPENHTHGDKKPSATFKPADESWDCHGCGAHGDKLTFAAIGLGFDIATYNKGHKFVEFLDALGDHLGVAKDEPEEVVEVVKEEKSEAVPEKSGWLPRDNSVLVRSIADGTYVPTVPDVGRIKHAEDALFFSGKVNMLVGKWGGGKSQLALHAAKEQVELGNRVIYIDMEDGEKDIYERLIHHHGCPVEAILKNFLYIHPVIVPPPAAAWAELKKLAANATLVVIDSTGKSLNKEGLDANSDKEFGNWFQRIPQPLSECGPAVVLVDHPPKADKKAAASGTDRKMADLKGAAYSVVKKKDWGPDLTGYSSVTLLKKGINQRGETDEEYTQFHFVAGEGFTLMRDTPAPIITPDDEKRIEILTMVMAHGPEVVMGDVVKELGGASAVARRLINELVASGHLSETKRGAARLLTWVKPLREG